jgi:hypothetical protein
MQIRCLGGGDAFGSGGRFHPCYHIAAHDLSMLLDCGPSALIAMMNRPGFDGGFVSRKMTTWRGGRTHGEGIEVSTRVS